ncbi:MAG: radical SAM protein [Lactobacillales bacterium]|jgi:radical SAM protein with 4Fe4S-binding SPASM domain|nr:radical SAM protein [Lactobacillales bacterium]
MKVNDFILEKINNNHYFYSISTGAISKISAKIYMDLENSFTDAISEDTKNLMDYIYNSPPIKKKHSKTDSGNYLGNLVFISSEFCNLKCKYCFVNKGNYHQTKPQSMSFECYKEAVEYVLNKHTGIKNICFFGGEPLINFKEIQKFIKYYRQLVKINGLISSNIGVITNGTLVNEKIGKFLEENNINVTLSIDGPKSINDSGRVSDVFSSVYDKVIFNFKNFYFSKKLLAVESTITNYHIKNYNQNAVAKWIKDLEQINFDFIAFLPAVTEDKDTKISDINILKKIYSDIVDYYFELLSNENSIKSIEIGVLGMIHGIIGKSYIGNCAIANSLLVTPRGDLYPCQAFYESKTYQIGNLKNDKDVIIYEELANLDRLNVPKCQNCIAKYLCGTWCVGMNNAINGKMESTINLSCIATQTTMERTLKNLFKIIDNKEKYNKFIKNIQYLIKLQDNAKLVSKK